MTCCVVRVYLVYKTSTSNASFFSIVCVLLEPSSNTHTHVKSEGCKRHISEFGSKFDASQPKHVLPT